MAGPKENLSWDNEHCATTRTYWESFENKFLKKFANFQKMKSLWKRSSDRYSGQKSLDLAFILKNEYSNLWWMEDK